MGAVNVATKPDDGAAKFSPMLGVRAAIAGVLMGLANLIPGVSGGTMILALGLYQEFVDSVAEVSALRLSVRRVAFLGIVVALAAAAIFGLAGVILYLLFHYPVVMFALFIGLTLGGAPLLLKDMRPVRVDAVVAAFVGVVAMVGVAALNRAREGGGFPRNTGMDFVSGLVGSTTMVLPGVSGSQMLLVMNQYHRVIGAVRDMKDAVTGFDFALLGEALWIVVPVGIGAVIGIVGLSNLLKILLARYRRVTSGVLLGIVLGSVVVLWPFAQRPDEDALSDRSPAELRGFVEKHGIQDAVGLPDEELVQGILTNWDARTASDYTAEAIVRALIAAGLGFGATVLLSRLGNGGGDDAAMKQAPARS